MKGFYVSDISQYRTELMGVATLLVVFGHSAGNGVVMPGWMESLCGLASVGVDIFLLVSGLGLWYSLRSAEVAHHRGGVIQWYKRRYKRILVPYLLIVGLSNILAISRGKSIVTAILDISTINYWINHKSAWYIAMLIPLYALTPLHDLICKKVKNPVLYSLVLLILIIGVSLIQFETTNVNISNFIENVRHVIVHLPAFYIGFMLAPMAKEGRMISLLWLYVIPILIVLIMKLTGIGYWPGFLFLPVMGFLCLSFHYVGKGFMSIFEIFGTISLESYLFNGAVGPWIIAYLPWIYYSSWNQGCYLHYALVFVIGTLLAYMVHQLCKKVFFKS